MRSSAPPDPLTASPSEAAGAPSLPGPLPAIQGGQRNSQRNGAGPERIEEPPERLEQRRLVDPLAVGLVQRDRPYYYFFKRLLDVTLTLLALVTLLPVMGVLALLIARDSPGPVIFAQQRVGTRRRRDRGHFYWQRRTFTIYKFRSMVANAGSELHRQYIEAYIAGDAERMTALQPKSEAQQSRFKIHGDPRITRIGAFLRTTSLDELPQLWNVLVGDMTLVGPRPAIPYEVEMYHPRHCERLEALPGMTGLWQVKGRGDLGFDDMIELDLEYVRSQSFAQDMMILFGTIPAVFFAKGAE